jgi:hypothetical protein
MTTTRVYQTSYADVEHPLRLESSVGMDPYTVIFHLSIVNPPRPLSTPVNKPLKNMIKLIRYCIDYTDYWQGIGDCNEIGQIAFGAI